MRPPYERFAVDRVHEELPIEGLNNRAFKDFTQYTHQWDWNKMDMELCLMMSQADLSQYPKVSGPQPPELQYGEFSKESKDDKYPLNVASLTEQQRRKLFYFRKESVIPWYFILNLKPSLFNERSRDTTDWNSEYDIPYTRRCIHELPFKEIGRVVVYATWATSVVPCHRDQLPGTDIEQMISFNPGGYRPLYCYDGKLKSKAYLDPTYKAYSYNTNDYHGVDSVPHFSYTVRVDGQYK